MPDFVELAGKIEEYEKNYYGELRKQTERYKQFENIIPDFLKGYSDIDILIATDGIVIVHWPSKQDLTCIKKCQSTIRRITMELNYFSQFKIYVAIEEFGTELDAYGTFFGLELVCKFGDQEVLFGTEWKILELAKGFSETRWNKEAATNKAIIDIQTCLLSHLLNSEGHNNSQIYNKRNEIVFDKYEAIIAQFESLLDSLEQMDPSLRERHVHEFLKENPALLATNHSHVYSEFNLGIEYRADFVICLPEYTYDLVEIESPNKKLYRENGDPFAEFTHAIQQAENWRRWVQDNIAYARTLLPNITDPHCKVIIGRRYDLNENNKDALRRRNLDSPHITILTYDDLLDDLKNTLKNLRAYSR